MPPEVGARNAKTGIDAANEYLGIPKLIAPEDMASPDVDDLRFGVWNVVQQAVWSRMSRISAKRSAKRKKP